MVIDAVTIVVAILLAGLGMFVGFGRTLRFFTDGIFGFIISVVFCFAFGGLIASIGPVAEGISWLNNWLGGVWSFLLRSAWQRLFITSFYFCWYNY